MEAVNAPVPKVPDSVVVAPYEALVPYAKPRIVGVKPPVALIVPFKITLVWVVLEAAWAETVGATFETVTVMLEVA